MFRTMSVHHSSHIMFRKCSDWLKKNTHYSGKQYRKVIQALQDEAGTGPGSPGPIRGRHRPIAVMYWAARAARGAGDKSATSAAGNSI